MFNFVFTYGDVMVHILCMSLKLKLLNDLMNYSIRCWSMISVSAKPILVYTIFLGSQWGGVSGKIMSILGVGKGLEPFSELSRGVDLASLVVWRGQTPTPVKTPLAKPKFLTEDENPDICQCGLPSLKAWYCCKQVLYNLMYDITLSSWVL